MSLTLAPAEQRKIVAGLQVSIFIAALDSTLVSVALLSIAKDLGGANLIAWVIAGYTVAATVATPVYGSLSDIYGRQRMMSIAIALYALACIACMFAQSMPQLLALRVIQGLGGGGLIVLSQATIGDVVPPEQRGKFQAWLSGTYALAALLGPITGGYLTAWFGWRSIFAVSLPLALIALLLTRRILARIPKPTQGAGIDYPSVAILTLGLTGFMTALTFFGQGIRFSDPRGLPLLAVSIILLIVFWRRQFKVAGPILAPDLLQNRQALWTCFGSSMLFFGLIGGSVMLPLALQSIAHLPPNEVALRMLMHALGVPIGAFISGRLLSGNLRFRRHIAAGALLSAVCALALSQLKFASPMPVNLAMCGLGLGIGFALVPGVIAVQLAVAPNRIGAATAFLGLARSAGSAVGLAFLSAVLFASVSHTGGANQNLSAASLITQSASHDPLLVQGFSWVFGCVALAMLSAALSGLMLQPNHKPNPTKPNPTKPNPTKA